MTGRRAAAAGRAWKLQRIPKRLGGRRSRSNGRWRSKRKAEYCKPCGHYRAPARSRIRQAGLVRGALLGGLLAVLAACGAPSAPEPARAPAPVGGTAQAGGVLTMAFPNAEAGAASALDPQ